MVESPDIRSEAMPAIDHNAHDILDIEDNPPAVHAKLDATNRGKADFDANDLGDPVQVATKLSGTGRTGIDFRANKVTNPGGSNYIAGPVGTG